MRKQAYQDHFQVEKTHWWFVTKRRYIATVLNSLKLSNVKILDVGCGTGATTSFLKFWGNVKAIDSSPLAVKFSRQNSVDAQLVTGGKLPFKGNSFDLIALFDVLYHKKVKPPVILAEIKRVLKVGGYVLVTDCALPQLWSEHDGAMEARERFTKNGLEKIIEDEGFRIIRSSYLFFLTFPLFYLSRKFSISKNGSLETSKSLSFLLEKLLKIETFFFNYLNLPIGSSLLVLAQKPDEKN